MRPDCDPTALISGNLRRVARICSATRAVCSREVPGGRFERIQIVPSSSVGRNSLPSEPASKKEPATTAPETPTTSQARRIRLALASDAFLHKVGGDFLPPNDEAQFEVYFQAPEGTTLEATTLMAERVARKIRAYPEIDSTLVTIADSDRRESNVGRIYVRLSDPKVRTKHQNEVMAIVRSEVLRAAQMDWISCIVSSTQRRAIWCPMARSSLKSGRRAKCSRRLDPTFLFYGSIRK